MKGGLPRSLRDLKQASDEDLMLAYQAGHEEAFMLLYERYSGKVYAFLSTRLRDRAVADDAFQATFLKLHQARGSYDPKLPFAAWLFTVCRTSMISILRTRKRVGDNESFDEVALANAAAATPESPANLPEFSGLPVKQRQALEMKYLNDLSFDEIAARLNTTPQNTRQLVSRAVRKLKNWAKGQRK